LAEKIDRVGIDRRVEHIFLLPMVHDEQLVFELDDNQCRRALGVTRNTLSELVNGERGISPEMAVRLSKVFGGTEEGWLVQQAQYDLAHVHRERIKLKRVELA
jgi:antitoxin HigA-1